MSSGFAYDPHSERGQPCPRNRFGITDYVDLQRLETPLVLKRAGELRDQGLTGNFDLDHLRSIHRYLFQDVFPWAGEFRVVNISRGNSSFAPAQFLAGATTDVLWKLSQEDHLRSLDAGQFAGRAAYFLGEINAIHPFREGNGRTQRELIRQLAFQAGHPLSWAGFTQHEMTEASIASHMRGDCSGLSRIIARSLLLTRAAAGETLL